MSRRGAAFTLLELLAVLAIAAIVMAMLGTGFAGDRREAEVRGAADTLASTLRRARDLAMSRQAVFGVAFNIENAPGSSGRILNNRGGGHWYRIIGPSSGAGQYETQGGRIPVAGGMEFGSVALWNFPDFTDEVARCWVGERIVLPRNRVRFLALGDTDEGPRTRRSGPGGAGTAWYGSGGETTYPRPWCGWWDRGSGELWAWGGYGAATATGRLASAFWYQGKDGAVSGCANPADRVYDNRRDLNGDGDTTDPGESVTGIHVLSAGAPRPLVNAAWLDAVIVFTPTGQAQFLEWNRNRRWYLDAPQASPSPQINCDGVRDMAKPPPSGKNAFTSSGYADDYDLPEVGHFVRHTGGWFITLAPDATDDATRFASAGDALATMLPAWRVFVGQWGTVRTLRVRHQEGVLRSHHLWPSDPADWLSTTATTANPVWQNCRGGWLHQASTASSQALDRLVPRGRPVVDQVDEQMLAERQWWIDE